jgi:hypothetical protein
MAPRKCVPSRLQQLSRLKLLLLLLIIPPTATRLTNIGSGKTGMNSHEQQRRLVDDNSWQVREPLACPLALLCPPPPTRTIP